MTSTRHHGDTEARATGIDALMQDGLEWAQANMRLLVLMIAGFLVVGLIVAGVYEMRRSARAEAAAALSEIEGELAVGLGGSRLDAVVPEPANQDQARRAREAALVAMDSFIAEHDGTPAALHARLRSAELEADLGRLEAADQHLVGLIGELADTDPVKGQALRLRGFVLEELERPQEAVAVYEQAGSLEAFPPRALAWITAARVHMRLGEDAAALRAYDRAIAIESDLAQDPALVRERRFLEAAIEAARAADPASASAPE
jgi:tetratricopeptide (TPR) repeat protein